jgi:hypothetical protein
MRSDVRRLRDIARRLKRCERHGDLLECGPCDWEWTGTDEEWGELIPLTECVERYMPLLPYQGVCSGCGETLWCATCHAEALAPIQVPPDLMTSQELDRFDRVKDLMRRKNPRSR